MWNIAQDRTRLIEAPAAPTSNVRWTSAGLSVSTPEGPLRGTLIWDGQTWSAYSPHTLWSADTSGTALLVEVAHGSTGGRVWKRIGNDERVLSAPGQIEYPLALDGDRAFVMREQPVAFVHYRGDVIERVVPAPAACRATQQWGRWLICTTGNSGAMAFSMDSDVIAVRAIAGLADFSSLAVLAKP
jgi:hypothetical protein